MRLYLASGNPHKARELQAMAGALDAGIEVVSAAAVGGMPEVVEDMGTFLGNATKKALALKVLLPEGEWALADDSGLCVDALDGLPGVDSAYYAGPDGESAANLAKLVEVMRPVPDSRRGAAFVCTLVLAGPRGQVQPFEGRCHGRLAREPRGTGGFGYDPLFVPDGFEVTLAQMAPEAKNSLSHRGRAWAQCVGWLAARG